MRKNNPIGTTALLIYQVLKSFNFIFRANKMSQLWRQLIRHENSFRHAISQISLMDAK